MNQYSHLAVGARTQGGFSVHKVLSLRKLKYLHTISVTSFLSQANNLFSPELVTVGLARCRAVCLIGHGPKMCMTKHCLVRFCNVFVKQLVSCEILGSHGCRYEDYWL